MHDPIYPENQLPYIDGKKGLIIPDRSTQLATLRTGQIDYMERLIREEMEGITNTNHNALTIPILEEGQILMGRCDKQELPFDDIRVRQALNLAVNKQAILDDYYGGHAEMLGPPYLNRLVQQGFYTPLEEQPSEPTIPGSQCSVQELFTYNPEKAKKLLTEAGYPNGFEVEVICEVVNVDYLSILVADYEKVGVTLKIKQIDPGTWWSTQQGKAYDAIFARNSGTNGVCHCYVMWRKDHVASYALWEDPVVRKSFNKVQEVLHKDVNEMNRLMKEIGPYILEQAVGVWLPNPEMYTVYHPWFQNFHGECAFGMLGIAEWQRFIWLDTALKESLGY
jgi:peptide/nickel transport system substrate-binding protein